MTNQFVITLVCFLALIPAIAICDNSNASVGQNSTVIGFTQEDIQSAIDAASPGNTVYLNPGNYTIETCLSLKSGVSLEGSGNNTIIRGDSTTGGISGSRVSSGWISGIGVSNIDISNMVFVSDAPNTKVGGHGESRNLIRLIDCSNITIKACQIKPFVYNDFVKSHNGKNIIVSGCSGQAGHDFVEFLGGSSNCEVTNCNIKIATNCGIRNDGTTDCRVDHNTITGYGGSGWCINEVEHTVTGLEIDHNIFHDYAGSKGSNVVQSVNFSGDVSTHDNVIWNCGSIEIGSTSNNTVNPENQDISYWLSQGYGATSINYFNNAVCGNVSNENDTNVSGHSCSDRDTAGFEIGDPNDINSNTTVNTNDSVQMVFTQLGILGALPMNASRADLNLSSAMLSSSMDEVSAIQGLCNGTEEQVSYAHQLMNESDYKEQVARDLFNFSIKNEEIAKGRA